MGDASEKLMHWIPGHGESACGKVDIRDLATHFRWATLPEGITCPGCIPAANAYQAKVRREMEAESARQAEARKPRAWEMGALHILHHPFYEIKCGCGRVDHGQLRTVTMPFVKGLPAKQKLWFQPPEDWLVSINGPEGDNPGPFVICPECARKAEHVGE